MSSTASPHPFDVLADGIDRLPAMAPGVAMPIGGDVSTLIRWLRNTPCRDSIDWSAVPDALMPPEEP